MIAIQAMKKPASKFNAKLAADGQARSKNDSSDNRSSWGEKGTEIFKHDKEARRFADGKTHGDAEGKDVEESPDSHLEAEPREMRAACLHTIKEAHQLRRAIIASIPGFLMNLVGEGESITCGEGT